MKRILLKCKFLIIVAAILFSAASVVAFYEAQQGNFHAITVGEAYRSAQLDNDELAYYVKKYQIKSILNLRGKNSASTWYKDEISFSLKNNVVHYDVALSAYNTPQAAVVSNLMDIFKHAPRPLLMHCQAGADRSGLVAAMWKVVVDKTSKIEADNQLSILYGHLSIGSASAMDNFFQKWNPDLALTKPL
jgi:undecaprenyl-diphosphatase